MRKKTVKEKLFIAGKQQLYKVVLTDLRAAGLSLRDLAALVTKETGIPCSKNTVARWLKQKT